MVPGLRQDTGAARVAGPLRGVRGAPMKCPRCAHARDEHTGKGCASHRDAVRCWCLMKPITVLRGGLTVPAWGIAPRRM